MAETKKILVVDDDPDCLEFVTAVLEDMGGCEVITGENGQQAVDLANSESPDLIILDVMMPEKDGYAAFCEIKQGEATGDIPVVMLSSLADMGGYMMGGGPQPKLFVAKPIAPDKLESMVARFVG